MGIRAWADRTSCRPRSHQSLARRLNSGSSPSWPSSSPPPPSPPTNPSTTTATSAPSSPSTASPATAPTPPRKADLRLDQKSAALASRADGPAIAPGDPEASNLVFRVEIDDPELQMPPAKFKKPLTAEQKATLRQLDRPGRPLVRTLGLLPPKQPDIPSTSHPALGPNPRRRLHPRPSRTGIARPLPPGRPRHPHPPPQPRPHRPPPHHRGSRRLPRRLRTRRLRPPRRTPPRLPPLRRALGPPLARRRPLRRLRRLRKRQAPLRLGLSRLCDQLLQ